MSEHRPFKCLHLLPSAPHQLVTEVYWHLAHQLDAVPQDREVGASPLALLNRAYEQILRLDRRMIDEKWEVYISEEGTRRRPSWLPAGTVRGWLWQKLNEPRQTAYEPWSLLHVDPSAPPDIVELAFAYCQSRMRSAPSEDIADLREAYEAVLRDAKDSPPDSSPAGPNEQRRSLASAPRAKLALAQTPVPANEDRMFQGADYQAQIASHHAVPRTPALAEVSQFSQPDDGPAAQGHVALYATDEQWRQAAAKQLAAAGHSYHEATTVEEVRRLLHYQRVDVLVLKVETDAEALGFAQQFEELTPPTHTIVLGTSRALPGLLEGRGDGTFRFVSETLSAIDLSRLVGSSIKAGTWQEDLGDPENGVRLELVGLEEVIERAASSVYLHARRKRLNFHVFVGGSDEQMLADRVKLGQILTSVLRLIVTLAPRGAAINVEARATTEGWTITVRSDNGKRSVADAARVAEELGDDAKALNSLSQDVREQGGMLWVELAGPASPAMCLMLPKSAP